MQILLGLTENGEFIFADVKIRNNVAISFDVVAPFEFSYEAALERIQENLEDVGDCEIGRLCQQFNCSPSDLPEILFRLEGVEAAYDISLYPESFQVQEKDIYFEFVACGQIDISKIKFKAVTDKSLLLFTIRLWKKYHLKKLPEERLNEIRKSFETHSEKIHKKDWITERILNNPEIVR